MSFGWTGRNSQGQIELDGEYQAEFVFHFTTGHSIVKKVSGIILDGSPPAPRLTVFPQMLESFGAEAADGFEARIRLRDFSAIQSWTVNTYWVNEEKLLLLESRTKTVQTGDGGNSANEVDTVITFTPEQLPQGLALMSMQRFRFELNAVDVLGNASSIVVADAETGLIADRSGKTVSLSLPLDLLFEAENADVPRLRQSGRELISRAVQKMQGKYIIPEYEGMDINLAVTVYTGSTDRERAGIMAGVVHQFLLDSGIQPQHLSYSGNAGRRLTGFPRGWDALSKAVNRCLVLELYLPD